MNRGYMKLFRGFILILYLAGLAVGSYGAASRPNIVLLYIDDWAWNGTPVAMDNDMINSFMPILEMPNLEKLARQGMKFTHAYGSPQCAPARVCIQTGQSTPRNGYTLVLGAMDDDY